MKEYVDLYGGFKDKTWERNIFMHRTLLDADEQGRIFKAVDNSRIDGFIIRNGKVRGKGGAIACMGTSPLISNTSLASNDAGGLFIALWSSARVYKNIFVNSVCGDDAAALFVGGQEHRYDAPLDPLPPKDKFYVDIQNNMFIANRNPSNNSGVTRFTMESRGRFSNNVCAYNTGVYFQRCEAEIVNNTMLENFILIETKEGLGKNYVKNNIIWGTMDVDAPADFVANDISEKFPGKNNISKDPVFNNNLEKIVPLKVSVNNGALTTELFVSGLKYKPGELVGRVVKTGDKWSVVKSNNGSDIILWGDLTGNLEYTLLPTFQLTSDSPCIDAGVSLKDVPKDFLGNSRTNKTDIGAYEFQKN